MLGSDACEFGGQLLELLRLAVCAREIMADKDGAKLPLEEEVDDVHLAYKAPEKKTLQEIQQLDQDDESLKKYKQVLLGPIPVTVDPSVANVTLTRLTLLCDQAPGPITMDLTGDLEALKSQLFVLKEGVDYRVKISFKVNKEIVCGLKYLHHTYRKGLKVDKDIYMVGSYGPRAEEYEFLTPPDEAPKGVLGSQPIAGTGTCCLQDGVAWRGPACSGPSTGQQ
ncbi:rho GDP-dissociation inhibitor 3 isoform X2 [Emydura macquarii macquarii]|uniref:rho GDP-dissociation inhibitor 3 isoform X2 n=1 Tax=Emydura macquarii macquarii TaxID=1129001 RepID=UPI00352A9E93